MRNAVSGSAGKNRTDAGGPLDEPLHAHTIATQIAAENRRRMRESCTQGAIDANAGRSELRMRQELASELGVLLDRDIGSELRR